MDPVVATRVVDRALEVGPRCGEIILIAIDGRSGAGKTTLSTAVAISAEARGLSSAVVHVDELCPGWNGLPAVPHRLAKIADDLAREGRSTYPTWDWYEDRPGPDAGIPRSDIVIIEGAAAADPRWAHLTSLAIWVDAPTALRQRRAITRDGDNFARHWYDWAAAEDAYFNSRGAREVDLVIEAG